MVRVIVPRNANRTVSKGGVDVPFPRIRGFQHMAVRIHHPAHIAFLVCRISSITSYNDPTGKSACFASGIAFEMLCLPAECPAARTGRQRPNRCKR